MKAKVSRRALMQTALAVAVADAQTPPPAVDLANAAREQNQRMGEALAKFEIPQATEPAFQFKA